MKTKQNLIEGNIKLTNTINDFFFFLVFSFSFGICDLAALYLNMVKYSESVSRKNNVSSNNCGKRVIIV